MVEGPGCKLKGEKIRSKLLKQSVKGVNGNAVSREEKNLKRKMKKEKEGGLQVHVSETAFHKLVGRPLEEVLTLGKELFMFFGDSCLRVHFLMAGSFRVNDVQVDTDGGRKIPASASLEIHFSKDTLTFYKCAAEIRPASACRQKHLNLKDLDICSPTFNQKRAVMEMMVEKDRQLCDVLLDQDILPGVGNIIKNEALFDSGLKPDSKIRELSEEHINHLVKMTRDFSMVFYKCRKNGTNLRLYMKVYQKGKCGECDTKIVMTRMGEDSERVTYFCPSCQTNEIRKCGKLKLPTKNSLLGWVHTDQNTAKGTEWACSMCTLLNPPNQINCTVCMNPKSSQSNSGADSGQQPAASLKSPGSDQVQMKRKLQTEMPSTSRKRLKEDQGGINPSRVKGGNGIMLSQLGVKQDLQNSNTAHHGAMLEDDMYRKVPACRGHGVRCIMRQTFKDNENKGRWFFTCAATPASKRCNFFQWADEHFPVCSSHDKVCALRTVMKQGANNGRRFFCCPMRQNSCQFFEWAVGYG